MLSNRVSFPADDSDFVPVDLFQTHRQVILHRRCIDPFDEPKIERLLSEVQADEFILIGVGAEEAVKATALGLLPSSSATSCVFLFANNFLSSCRPIKFGGQFLAQKMNFVELPNQVSSHSQYGTDSSRGTNNIPKQIAPFFIPPPELAHDFGEYRSPLRFYDGTPCV